MWLPEAAEIMWSLEKNTSQTKYGLIFCCVLRTKLDILMIHSRQNLLSKIILQMSYGHLGNYYRLIERPSMSYPSQNVLLSWPGGCIWRIVSV